MATLFCLLAFLVPSQEDPIPSLLKQLEDESPAVRDAASRSLREFGKSAAPALRELLTHKDAEVRTRLVDLLRHLDWDNTLDPTLLSRYPPLRKAFEDGDHAAVMRF